MSASVAPCWRSNTPNRSADVSEWIVHTTGPEETRALARRLAGVLRPGDVLFLHGDLGAGKTTFTQGLLAALQKTAPVQSPTFTLVLEHEGVLPDGTRLAIHHIDLYRLDDPDEIDSFGYEELIDTDDAIVIVEWPERAAHIRPERFLLVTFSFAGPDQRDIGIAPSDDTLRVRLEPALAGEAHAPAIRPRER
jgi:tRNA threonylcarbamoyladenosine biosynthesis protein TsaE